MKINHTFTALLGLVLAPPTYTFVPLQQQQRSLETWQDLSSAAGVVAEFSTLPPQTIQSRWNIEVGDLRGKTSEILSEEVGSLRTEVLDDSFDLLNAWAKTQCPTGASTAENLLLRLEEESSAGNENVALSSMHYAVVSLYKKSNEARV